MTNQNYIINVDSNPRFGPRMTYQNYIVNLDSNHRFGSIW